MTDIKKMQIRFDGMKPMSITGMDEAVALPLTTEQLAVTRALLDTVKAYLKTASRLIAGKYKHLNEIVPNYLSNPGNAFVAWCPDGVVIRYESKSGEDKQIGIAYIPEGIAHAALFLSQKLVRVLQPGEPNIFDEDLGLELKLTLVSPSAQSSQDLVAGKILFSVVNEKPQEPHASSSKPYCLLSVGNRWQMELHGTHVTNTGGAETEIPFIAKSEFRIGVGWDCIEVFPGFEISAWKPEYAALWAENDLLSAALLAQLREEHYRSLDPKAGARKHWRAVLADFRSLLDSEPDREQLLQTFLETNPALLCPTYIRIWPKLPLGAKITDFVFCDAANDYLLVELERSTLSLFRQDGHATSELTHAHGQIIDWKRYLEDNLQTVQRELGLDGITPNPNGLLVIGRSASLLPENRRKLQTMMNESPKLRVMTYDDLYENAKAVFENLLGPMWDAGGVTEIIYPVSEQLPS